MSNEIELTACTPHPVDLAGFNLKTKLPYGLTVGHLQAAMNDFTNFIGFINLQLHSRKIERLESMLMPANFSSIVGEFMSSSIPKHCSTLVKNQYHNGHPDMLPTGRYPSDAVQHADDGIEIKGSRYLRGWQGHNPEDTWLMVFVFDSNRPVDVAKEITPRPFKFVMVLGARITKNDWLFSGRSETSRRTITASITKSGYQKMMENWIYKAPDLITTDTASLLDSLPSEPE
jgi:hypothetical protein